MDVRYEGERVHTKVYKNILPLNRSTPTVMLFGELGTAPLDIAVQYYQLSHGCQGDTEKYLTRGNLYRPRNTCITQDVVEGNTGDVVKGNTGVSRVIHFFESQIISLHHPGNHVITDIIIPQSILLKSYWSSTS